MAGHLLLPECPGPHPVVIVVAVSGPNTRTGVPLFRYVRRRYCDAGFAVISWDKPVSG